ncbi:MAG: hypothetical protein ACFWTJ_02565 [Lachnoclostridium sp.]
MKKGIILLFLACILAVTAFTGCTSKASSAGDSKITKRGGVESLSEDNDSFLGGVNDSKAEKKTVRVVLDWTPKYQPHRIVCGSKSGIF